MKNKRYWANLELQKKEVVFLEKNLLGIDYGEKYTGIAVATNFGGVFPLKVVETSQSLDQIRDLAKKYEVKKIIFGLPLPLNKSTNHLCAKIKKFAKGVRKNTETEIDYVDEKFSSRLAESVPNQRIDDQAAAKILEFYIAKIEKKS